MESPGSINLNFAVAAILGMLVLTILLILFSVAYQKRLLREQMAREAERAEHQKELLRATVDSQEREQRRMAAELHDGAGALLSTTRVYLQQLRLQPQSPEAKTWLQTAESLIGDTVQTIRHIAQNLQPAELENIGLHGALRTLAETVAGSGKLHVDADLTPIPGLPPETQLLVYRMVQELVSNCLKHAQAKGLRILLAPTAEGLRLEVADDGQGFDRAVLPVNRRSMGLKTLESRANLLGGALEWDTAPGRGTRITLLVPLTT